MASEFPSGSGRQSEAPLVPEPGPGPGDGHDLGGTVAAAKDKMGQVASDLAAPIRDRMQGLADEQKRAGAEQASHVARAIHSAASELERESPQAARYVHEAASGLEQMAAQLRDRDVNELIGSVSRFARQQPLAFFGGSVLAGFVLSRFLKSSGGVSAQPQQPQQPQQSSQPAGMQAAGPYSNVH